MKIRINDVEFNLIIPRQPQKDKTPIIFLHGFTGCAEDWRYFVENLSSKYFPIAIDLIGHGKSSKPTEKKYYSTNQIVRQLNNILKTLNLNNICLVGYSMGGRISLSYALKYPESVKALILESTSPGIKNEYYRRLRVENDKKIVKLIIEQGLNKFLDFWLNQPLFETQNKIYNKDYENFKKSKYKNSPIGLANTLLGFSTGKMPSYWDRLQSIKQKTLLITGSKDKKFTELNKLMKKQLNNSKHIIIKNVGHNTHLEKKNEYLIILKNYLRKIK
ncbi:MAG: 2-succinyl-6-hydroxy-2,4-cyclohexadiene-1-carboxylate synthase [Ignavibacteriales bacterium]|nr:2-succinyl-6-hydroxy-2,4-cyclohexadiene-1-carboxylate synthase [Ignavibacteriales bacterium]